MPGYKHFMDNNIGVAPQVWEQLLFFLVGGLRVNGGEGGLGMDGTW